MSPVRSPRSTWEATALAAGLEPREVLVGKLSRLVTALHEDLALLCSRAELSPDVLASFAARIDRIGLASVGLERARDGGRRTWVVQSVLQPLGTLLASEPDDAAWSSWLALQAYAPEPDGPYPDVMGALLADDTIPLSLAAARSLSSKRRGRKPASAPSSPAYAPLRALLERLPDGDGGTLGTMSDDALRKLVERSRIRTGDVASSLRNTVLQQEDQDG